MAIKIKTTSLKALHEAQKREAEMEQMLLSMSASLPEDVAVETPSVFPVWTAGVKYKKDAYLSYGLNSVGDPQLYRSLTTHKAETGKEPGTTRAESLYKIIGTSPSGYPIWVEPASKKDAYNKGDIVDRNGTLYQSTKNNNMDDPLDETGTWSVYTPETD